MKTKFNGLQKVTLLLACILSLSAFSGCAGNTSTLSSTSGTSTVKSENTTILDLNGRTIRFYIYGYDKENPVKSQADQKREDRLAEIKEKFNCKIEILTGADMVHPAIFQSIMAGSPVADIIDGGGPHVISSPLKSKCYIDLTTLGVFNLKDKKWDPLVIDALTFNGKTYGVMPVQQGIESIMFNQVLYFNKQLVKDAGYNPDDLYTLQKEGKWTWDKFEEIVVKISNLSATKGTTIWGTIGNEGNLFNNLVFSNNTDWIKKTADGLKFDAGNPNSLEAINFYKNLYDKKGFPEAEANSDPALFISGKVGFMPDYLERIQKNYPKMKDDYGLLLMPKGPKATDYASQMNWFTFWSLPTGAKNPKDLAKVLDYFCNPYWDSETEVDEMTQTQMESYVRDKGSIDTLNMVFEKSKFSPISYEFAVSSAWYYEGLPLIKSGAQTPSGAIAAKQGEYDAIFKQWADFE